MFLYGLGTGLIIATLLLQLLNYKQESKSLNKDAEALGPAETADKWDDLFMGQLDEITEAAERNGYRVISENKVPPEETNDKGSSTSESEPQDDDLLMDSTETAEEVFLTISSGMGSGEVARELYELKLIENIDEFIQLLNSKQLNTRIQVGSYRFEGSPEMNQIIEEITNS